MTDQVEKSKLGRPRVFEDPKEMQKKIDEYFRGVDASKQPPTIAGLSYHLGFSDRHTLTEYAKYPTFSATVKRAKLRIEIFLETRLLWDGPVTGPIFNLKNNFDWQDKKDINLESEDRSMSPNRELSIDELREEARRRGLPDHVFDD